MLVKIPIMIYDFFLYCFGKTEAEMFKRFVSTGILPWLFYAASLGAHCQMPCGIYHDEMVYDQVDQYVETMYKALSILQENKFETIVDKNQCIRWVIEKEQSSDEVASIFTTYFLQQKIKPGEIDTVKRVTSAHKLLFLLVGIKQGVDLKLVEAFADEWEKFKLMFHVEGYECKVEQIKLKKRQELMKKAGTKVEGEDDVHDHDHSHGPEDHHHD